MEKNERNRPSGSKYSGVQKIENVTVGELNAYILNSAPQVDLILLTFYSLLSPLIHIFVIFKD